MYPLNVQQDKITKLRCGSRTAATFTMEHFAIIVNGFQPLTIITKRSILDVPTVLDPPLKLACQIELNCSMHLRDPCYTL